MSWLPISSDAVLSEFTPQESATIQRLQGANSLPAVLGRVVSEIRDYIRGGSYPLDPDPTTIPEGLHNDAIDMARWRLLISIPALVKLQTEDRKNACERAESKLDKIAAQKFAVEPPVVAGDPAPVTPKGAWGSENKIIPRTHPVPRPGTQFSPQAGSYSNPNAPQDFSNNS